MITFANRHFATGLFYLDDYKKVPLVSADISLSKSELSIDNNIPEMYIEGT